MDYELFFYFITVHCQTKGDENIQVKYGEDRQRY